MKRATGFIRSPLYLGLMLAALGPQAAAEEAQESANQIDIAPPMEEVVVIGRLLSIAAQLDDERLDDEVVSNLLGADDITRLGDATVATALRRISGLTLVQDSFVYVRGLGERYSSTTLNGARVPSPDLTRSVIPLDIFPTSIVESLRVQKSYSADKQATFGGGNVDIRTRGIPNGPTFGVEIGGGFNTEVSGDVLTYNGGGDDSIGTDDGTRKLSGALRQAIIDFQGNISTSNILSTLRDGAQPDATLADAQAINRDLALLLNRDISLKDTDADPDFDARIWGGSSFFVDDYLELGFHVSGQYEREWRERTQVRRNFGRPTEQTDTELESTFSINITGNANAGINWADEQEIVATGLFLRNTDDETAVRTFFDANREVSSGIGFQNFRLLYEEREMRVGQLRGEHRFGRVTKDVIGDTVPFLRPIVDFIPEDTTITWFYSDSDATTDIPNQVEIRSEGASDGNGVIAVSTVLERSNAADYRFTELDDEVLDTGFAVTIPFALENAFIEISAGSSAYEQARTYEQVQFELGPITVGDQSVLAGPLGDVFSDTNITDPNNNFSLERTGTNTESYVAATKTEAGFFKFDGTWNERWRVSVGARYEQYRQVGLDLNPFGFGAADPIITNDPDELLDATFYDDDWYPSVSFTFIDDWLAETFQFRLGFSETVTRPDLREITDASYVDPLTNDIVNGNPGVTPSTVRNYDARAEWFLGNGDNFTISLYYKDIENPIEFFEAAASDTNVAREIVNADSAEIIGAEFEFLKGLNFLGGWAEPFFVQGNLTIQDSELVAGTEADAPTNQKREMVNAAPWIVNLQLGFDSLDGKHSATLAYNVYDERLFVAGRNGAPDGFEQPFHELGLTYQWYPTDRITVRAKLQNLLDDSIEIERGGVTSFEEEIGRTVSIAARWSF